MKNKRKRKFIIIMKWGGILFALYWLITTLIFGHTNLDSKTGVVSFRWSGLDALFSDEEFGFLSNEQYKTYLKGADGPYVFQDSKFWVNNENKLVRKHFNRNEPIAVRVNNKEKDEFQVTLKNTHQQEIEMYALPNKLIAISDIEGNFNAFQSFLLNNKVIDTEYNWTFGTGHLVLNGDFFDRGESVTQVLWLIYMLEDKAEKQGGKVHFINGNHEIMNLYGEVSYTDLRYVEVAKQISNEKYWNEATKFLYSESSELGEWLRTKNVIEKIGDYIFVHGGLKKQHIDAQLSISEINEIAKKYYGVDLEQSTGNVKDDLVVGSHNSPYWDRSFSMNLIYKTMFFLKGAPTHKTSESELDEILKFYDSKKIVIGHSVVDDVSLDYNRKVLKIDVKHGIKKNSKNTQGLLIENGIEYKVDGLGAKEKL